MSANDYIDIKQDKDGFQLSVRDADTGYALEHLNPAKTLESAIREANKIQQERVEDGCPVEYGIRVKFRDD